MEAGYYTLTIQLQDGHMGGIFDVWGMVEAVRILKGETTLASLNLTMDDNKSSFGWNLAVGYL